MKLALPTALRARPLFLISPLAVVGIMWGGQETCRRSEFFRVRQVEIIGADYLAADRVASALALGDRPSICDGLLGAQQRVLALPGVADAEVGRRFPGAVWVRVREVPPVAFVPLESGLTVVGAHGEQLPFDPLNTRLDLPVVNEPVLPLLALLARLQLVAPAFAERIAVATTSRDALVVQVDSIRVLFSPGADTETVRGVTAVSLGLTERGIVARELDARFDGQVVVRPRDAS